MKPLIICIVGESGSGKSCLSDHLTETFKIHQILSYTTRPRREAEKTVTSHTHISEDEFDKIESGDMIAYTKYGEYRYCCVKGQVGGKCIYIIDEDGLDHLKEGFSDDFYIKSVRLSVSDDLRLERLCNDTQRFDRDSGRFTKSLDDFDYVLDTSKSTEDNKEGICKVYNQIISDFYGSTFQ